MKLIRTVFLENSDDAGILRAVPRNAQGARLLICGAPEGAELVAVLQGDKYSFTRCPRTRNTFSLPDPLFRSWRDVHLFLFPAGKIGMREPLQKWTIPVVEEGGKDE